MILLLFYLYFRLDLNRDVLRNRAAALRVQTDKSYRQRGHLRDEISLDFTPLHIFTDLESSEMNKGGRCIQTKVSTERHLLEKNVNCCVVCNSEHDIFRR